MAVIQTRRLSKDFGQRRGLFDLSFDVPQGRVHGFLGPNGAGKTTAIRLLLGFLRPTYGAAKVLGRDPQREAAAIKQEIGYVPGDLAMPHMLRAGQWLQQSAAMRGGLDLDWRDQLVERLQADLTQRIGTLSKGNRQKVALIDALQHRPRLLIMDEPTDGLDPLLRDRVRDLLREHVQRGGTVFLSSHIVHEIQTMCDDVSIVLAGRLRKQARIQDLIAMEGLVVEATVADSGAAQTAMMQAGAAGFSHRGGRIRVRARGDPLPVLAALHRLGAKDARLRQGDLEELFLRLYAEDAT